MTSRSSHVLIVEDDEVTRAKLAGYLEAAGHQISEAADGRQTREALAREAVDLVLLDINLPGEDGLDLTRFIRSRSDVGVILLTGRTEDVDRIIGLEIGADDYVTKPFNPRELLARVKTVLRRASGRGLSERPVREFAGWAFDTRTRKLTSPAGQRVPLTRAEYELMLALVERPGVVLARERLGRYPSSRFA